VTSTIGVMSISASLAWRGRSSERLPTRDAAGGLRGVAVLAIPAIGGAAMTGGGEASPDTTGGSSSSS
jgi:hypothetical protein